MKSGIGFAMWVARHAVVLLAVVSLTGCLEEKKEDDGPTTIELPTNEPPAPPPPSNNAPEISGTPAPSVESGKPYAFDGKRLLIRFLKSFSLQREQASRPESLEFMRAMFERYFGHAVEIVCFSEGEEKAMALDEAMQKKPPEERFRDISEEHKPAMQRLIKEFDGEIVRYQT